MHIGLQGEIAAEAFKKKSQEKRQSEDTPFSKQSHVSKTGARDVQGSYDAFGFGRSFDYDGNGQFSHQEVVDALGLDKDKVDEQFLKQIMDNKYGAGSSRREDGRINLQELAGTVRAMDVDKDGTIDTEARESIYSAMEKAKGGDLSELNALKERFGTSAWNINRDFNGYKNQLGKPVRNNALPEDRAAAAETEEPATTDAESGNAAWDKLRADRRQNEDVDSIDASIEKKLPDLSNDEDPGIYEVVSGDTYYDIAEAAKRKYGLKGSVDELWPKLQEQTGQEPTKLQVGTKIDMRKFIDGLEREEPAAEPEKSAEQLEREEQEQAEAEAAKKKELAEKFVTELTENGAGKFREVARLNGKNDYISWVEFRKALTAFAERENLEVTAKYDTWDAIRDRHDNDGFDTGIHLQDLLKPWGDDGQLTWDQMMVELSKNFKFKPAEPTPPTE